MSEPHHAPPSPYRLPPEVTRRVQATAAHAAAARSRRRTALVVAVARAERSPAIPPGDPRLN